MTVKSGYRPRCHRRLSSLGHQKLVPVSLRSLGGRSWESAVLSFYLCTRCKSYKAVPKSTTALINVVSQGNRGRLLRRKTLTELGKSICFSEVLSLMTHLHNTCFSRETIGQENTVGVRPDEQGPKGPSCQPTYLQLLSAFWEGRCPIDIGDLDAYWINLNFLKRCLNYVYVCLCVGICT